MIAVIFTTHLKADAYEHGYAETSELLEELAKSQPGYRGLESARGADAKGITISYWDSIEDAKAWGRHPDHQKAQMEGKTLFYHSFETRYTEVIERPRD